MDRDFACIASMALQLAIATSTMTAVRPRLLVLASTYPRWPGDPEPAFVHELAKRLGGDFDVTVICPHARGAAPAERLEGVEVVRYRYAPARMETLVNDGGIMTNLRGAPWKWLLVPGFLCGMAWATLRALMRSRHDVIHAHWLIPQGLTVALLATLRRSTPPFLVTSHGADLFALRAPWLQGLKRYVARRAGAITVVSSAMREELQRIGVDPASVRVQPMGVDLRERFTPDAATQRSRDEILFVGRLVEKKGLRHLIAAMPEILRTRPSAHLTIAGFGPEEAACRDHASRLGLGDKVRFVGAVPQSDLPGLYRHAAVFVAPFVATASGDREGLGLVVVEAVGCGCPIVAGDLPSVREIFGNRISARLVPPEQTEILAASIVRVLEDPVTAAQHAAALRASVCDRFDWSIVADNYSAALQSLVRQGG